MNDVRKAVETERRTIQVALFSLCKNRYRELDFSDRFAQHLYVPTGCGDCEICKIGEAIQIGNYYGAALFTEAPCETCGGSGEVPNPLYPSIETVSRGAPCPDCSLTVSPPPGRTDA